MKKIVTALASYGMSGEVFHAPLLHAHSHFDLKYIVQRNKTHAQERYAQVTILKRFEEVLDNAEIELVIVNTPNALHFPMVKACLLAGKHVVVEKPFTIKSKEAEYLIDLAKQQNLVLTVFHNK